MKKINIAQTMYQNRSYNSKNNIFLNKNNFNCVSPKDYITKIKSKYTIASPKTDNNDNSIGKLVTCVKSFLLIIEKTLLNNYFNNTKIRKLLINLDFKEDIQPSLIELIKCILASITEYANKCMILTKNKSKINAEEYKIQLNNKYKLEKNKLKAFFTMLNNEKIESEAKDTKINNELATLKSTIIDNKKIIINLKNENELKEHLLERLDKERIIKISEISELKAKVLDITEKYNYSNNSLKKSQQRIVDILKEKENIHKENILLKHTVLKLETEIKLLHKNNNDIKEELDKLEKNKLDYLLKKKEFTQLIGSKEKYEKEVMLIKKYPSFNVEHIGIMFNKELDSKKNNYKFILKAPTFYTFIQDCYTDGLIDTIKNEEKDDDFYYTQLAKLRAFYDGLYKNYLLSFEYEDNYLLFNEQLYIFLNNYSLDKINRKIRPALLYEDRRNMVSDFFYFVNNDKYKFLWEVNTIGYFITGKYSNDEIFFYLTAKNLIYNGSHSQNISSSFNIINYVKFNYVKKIIQKYLEHWVNYDKFIALLANYTIAKNNCTYIDGYFVSRALLEVYCEKKNESLKKVAENFVFYKKNIELKNKLLSFSNFQLFIKNTFESVSDKIIIRLYTNAFNIGNGSIEVPSLLGALELTNILCYQIYNRTQVLTTEKSLSFLNQEITSEINFKNPILKNK